MPLIFTLASRNLFQDRVRLIAQVTDLRARVKELEARLEELEARLDDDEEPPGTPSKPA